MDRVVAAVLTPEETAVDAIEQAFLALMGGIAEVTHALDYRPERYDQPTVCMYFDWEDEVARSASAGRGLVIAEWEWVVDIYVPLYDRREGQRAMRAIILKMREALREDRLLGRTVKKKPALNNLGPAAVVRQGESGPILFKRFRLVVEREV